MPTRDTSFAALPGAQRGLSALQQSIVNALRTLPATRKELAQRIDKPINCITAPVKALIDAGVIAEDGWVRHEDTNCRAYLLQLVPEVACPSE